MPILQALAPSDKKARGFLGRRFRALVLGVEIKFRDIAPVVAAGVSQLGIGNGILVCFMSFLMKPFSGGVPFGAAL